MTKLIGDKNVPSQPDPYIIFSRGRYYIYATNANGVTVFESDRLGDFEYRGFALTVEGQKDFWAPCVLEHDGQYYMYYSSLPTDQTDVHMHQLRVAVSSNPLTGFEYKCDLVEPFSIDAHVIKNQFGDLFLFYSANDYEAERAGTLILVDRLISPTQAEKKPTVIIRPTLDQEIFCRDRFKKGQHWHTIEGAFYFRVGDLHFVTYSGNCYQNTDYYVGYAVARGNERDLRKLEYQKYPSDNEYRPLLCKNQTEEGTGHNSIIEVDGEFYIVYHARDLSHDSTQDARTARISKLSIKNDKINIAQS